jgi:hypothetical protein
MISLREVNFVDHMERGLFFASVQLANERWETVEEEDRRCTCFWKRVVRR